MFISKKKLNEIVDQRVRSVLSDKYIALDYLTGLTKAQLNRFNEAVELRRQSEAKLEKLEEVAPDLDNILSTGLDYEER